MGTGDAVTVCVMVGMGVAVGGKTICVTKLHASRERMDNPNASRLIFMQYLKNHGQQNPRSRVAILLLPGSDALEKLCERS